MEVLFPDLVQDSTPYNLRNNSNYVSLQRRTELYSNSFLPSSVKEWNQLDTEIRNASSLSIFKSKLKEKFQAPKVPIFYLSGKRLYSVYHARIRNNCSNLNNDLYRNHLRVDPSCQCGDVCENAEHFFFKCSLYHEQRVTLFRTTQLFHPLNTNTLLFGKNNLLPEENEMIFAAVQNYIKHTNRFVN